MHSSIHHQCIHQCIVNVSIASNASISLIQFLLLSSVHRQYIYQCITNVLIDAFIRHHQCNPSIHRQCIFNASIMHHQRLFNALSMHSSTYHHALSVYLSCIINAFINTFSDQYTINASSLHQFRSFNSFFHLSNSSRLVHLRCCSFIRLFVAVTPSAFLVSILNSLYPSIPIHFSGLHSSVRRSFLYSTIYYYIISVPR